MCEGLGRPAAPVCSPGGQHAAEAELDAASGQLDERVDLAGIAETPAEVAPKRGQDRRARPLQPADDRRAVHAVGPRELLEGDPVDQVEAQEVALARRQRSDRVLEGALELAAALRLDELELRVRPGDRQAPEVVAGAGDLAAAAAQQI